MSIHGWCFCGRPAIDPPPSLGVLPEPLCLEHEREAGAIEARILARASRHAPVSPEDAGGRVLAAYGYGKTRAGAEWADSHAALRIAACAAPMRAPCEAVTVVAPWVPAADPCEVPEDADAVTVIEVPGATGEEG